MTDEGGIEDGARVLLPAVVVAKTGPDSESHWVRIDGALVNISVPSDRLIPRGIIGKFRIGCRVEKTGGDYYFLGRVVVVFPKLSGKLRYVVENDAGILHIFSEANLTEAVTK